METVLWISGGEWDYVIFSTVRSLPDYRIERRPTQGWRKKNLGFITDQHQLNVALTRARKGLIIIGTCNNQVWSRLRDAIKILIVYSQIIISVRSTLPMWNGHVRCRDVCFTLLWRQLLWRLIFSTINVTWWSRWICIIFIIFRFNVAFRGNSLGCFSLHILSFSLSFSH